MSPLGTPRAGLLLALAALLAPWVGARAQDDSMSLEEASYRAGKARIMARYHEDLTTCKGLGNAHARSACAAAAGVNRDAARRALKQDTGPTRLGRYLAQMAHAPREAGRVAAQGPTHAAPAKATAPAQLVAATAARPARQAPSAAPTPRGAMAPAVVSALAMPAPSAQPAMTLVPVAAQARPVEPESARVDGFALALKTHYGGN